MKFIVVIISSILFFYACQTRQKEFTSMNEGMLVNKNFYVSLPYQYTSDSAAVLEIVIKGKRRRFMVDTGAPLCISKSIQEELNFPVLYETHLKDSNGDSSHVEIVRVKEINIGTLQFKDIPALVLDLAQPILACDSLDGLIGSNMLRLLCIQFDKPAQTIRLANSVDSFHLKENTWGNLMKVRGTQSDPVIPVSFNDQVTDTVLYDTGDKTFYTISKQVLQEFEHNKQQPGNKIATGYGSGAQGIIGKNKDSIASFIFHVDSLFIGRKLFSKVDADMTEDNVSRMGRSLWNYGLVTMDYPQQTFYLSMFGDSIPSVLLSDFGFRVQERNGKLVVGVVWNNTKAFACGLRTGFEITRFGNLETEKIPFCEWQSHFSRESENEVVSVQYVNEKGEKKECVLEKITWGAD
jgi:predicted aspartyl protease